MMTSSLTRLFERDLDKLIKEVSAYQSESNMWITDKEIRNSGGNLAIHLCGNLQHFIGGVLGNTGYIRNRDFEFHGKDVPRDAVLEEIGRTKSTVLDVLHNIEEQVLQEAYPLEVFGFQMTTEFFLIHLSGHLNYHLGQINYHRRLLDK
ncbi:MAG: DUF1572 family protein [Saprospiraceae bacterium]|nr:DUF1572 family protein [Saprospiraceae bacterium]